jgi:outer membrane lipoprotein-sorting protein
MRRFAFLIILSTFFCVATSSIQAQDVDKIIALHYKKAGGIKNWQKLKSLKSTAKIIQQGMEIPVVLLQKLPNKQRIDADFQGKKFVQAYNGKEGWMINPYIQATEPTMLTGDDLKELEDQMTFDNPLIDYKTKGNVVEFEGAETIEGIEYDKLKLTTKRTGNSHYYLFAKGDNTLKVILRRTVLSGPMKGQTGESYLSDYRAVGDLMMPFSAINKVQGQTVNEVKIDHWEIDPEIEDAYFDFPGK